MRAQGYTTACAVEKSGRAEFDFEYGEDFAAHLEKFRPSFAKALLRYNPEGDGALNARQAARLASLSDYLHRSAQSHFMIELLVPPEKAQIEKVGGDQDTYDRELRPQLMVGAIQELQHAGVEPERLESRRTRGAQRLRSHCGGSPPRRARAGELHRFGTGRG